MFIFSRNLALLIFLAVFSGGLTAQIITEKEYFSRPHFEVTTKTATYLFDRAGGGFSSMKDIDGLEWIGFKPGLSEVPESAASDFRGIPNLVFRGNDHGAGHPGFEQCISTITGHNQITSITKSGHWKWSWTFSDQGALLEILETDTSRNYWFLFEGTPGGLFDPHHQFWGNNLEGVRSDAPPIGAEQTGNGKWNWAFFGHEKGANILFVVQLTSDSHNDTFSYMGNSAKGIESEDGMVVFGFGRVGSTPLMTGPNQFFIGMYHHVGNNSLLFKGLQHYINLKSTY